MCPCEEEEEAVAALPARVCGTFSRQRGVFVQHFWSRNMVRRFLGVFWAIVCRFYARRSIILRGARTLRTERLSSPHPRVRNRAFLTAGASLRGANVSPTRIMSLPRREPSNSPQLCPDPRR